ncbi:hypothetical protein B0J11DRAFT_521442 [Dendryphion nanum]|uniref:Uncharacterized protein n=1 Tax=Dendryphion nanum TaxID=256645 RepID=A0A9P9E7Q8_9PLEO|nr:hypothetical protein B0J11DRAFT_521442 [Dendryphion nanum]
MVSQLVSLLSQVFSFFSFRTFHLSLTTIVHLLTTCIQLFNCITSFHSISLIHLLHKYLFRYPSISISFPFHYRAFHCEPVHRRRKKLVVKHVHLDCGRCPGGDIDITSCHAYFNQRLPLSS